MQEFKGTVPPAPHSFPPSPLQVACLTRPPVHASSEALHELKTAPGSRLFGT